MTTTSENAPEEPETTDGNHLDVTVKGWRNGLLLLVPPGGAWDAVMARVDAKLDEAKARSFWRGAQTTLDCGPRAVSLDEMGALVDRVKRAYGLVPIAVVAADPATRAAGEKLALVAYAEMPVVRKPSVREIEIAAGMAAPDGAEGSEPAAAAAPAPAVPNGANALYQTQTVRSGQRIVHDGHLVICGDVNAGAEVVAGGDVVVFGTLRGLAHAGCYGDENARIVALSLRPPQLRIAGKIARSPEEAKGAKGTASAPRALSPEVARIEKGEIGVFPL